MGSKGGGGRSSLSGSQAPTVVCCMCGDYGLRDELFRCKVCLHRSQHKYCSDLYPRAEIYTACNWCLREGGKSLTKNTSSSFSSSSNDSTNSGGNGNRSGGGSRPIHRTAFRSQINKPIKKQKAPERSKSDVTDRLRSAATAAAAAGMSPASGGGRHIFRTKVRRYKLLEEVSS